MRVDTSDRSQKSIFIVSLVLSFLLYLLPKNVYYYHVSHAVSLGTISALLNCIYPKQASVLVWKNAYWGKYIYCMFYAYHHTIYMLNF